MFEYRAVNFQSWLLTLTMANGNQNRAVKRGNIMAHLRKLGADIIFLQETHLKKSRLVPATGERDRASFSFQKIPFFVAKLYWTIERDAL